MTNMTNSSKNIQKTLKCFNGDTLKSQKLLTRFIDQYRAKEVPINKVFYSKHKENFKKAREAITPIANTVKLCGRCINIPLYKSSRKKKVAPQIKEIQ